MNAKWLFKLSGLYQLPLEINVSAFYNARQGYPQEISIQRRPAPRRSRPTAAATGTVSTSCSNPVGETRLPNFHNVDFHVERPVAFGSLRFVPSLDVFNLANANTVQAIRSRQNADERQPDPGDRRAAGHPLRGEGDVVNS